MWWKSDVVAGKRLRVSDRLTCCDWNNSNRQTGHKSSQCHRKSVSQPLKYWSLCVCLCMFICECRQVMAALFEWFRVSDRKQLPQRHPGDEIRSDFTLIHTRHCFNANHTQMHTHTPFFPDNMDVRLEKAPLCLKVSDKGFIIRICFVHDS